MHVSRAHTWPRSALCEYDDQNFSVLWLFEYLPGPAKHHPPRGPADGGTFVSISGDFFHERSAGLAYLQCRFNDTSVLLTLSRPGVQCYTPEMPPGVVDVAITNNLADYSTSVLFYEYSLVRLLWLDPHEEPTSGGTVVQVMGISFSPSNVFCHFAVPWRVK